MNKLNKGFAPTIILIVALLAVGLGGYIYFQSQDNPITSTTTTVPEFAITTTTTLVKTADWSCGDSVTFTYKGNLVIYGTVESQGRCWLDRNLGASQVATAYNDYESYGDFFQWGRLDDGHQTRTSGITTILSSTDNPGHSNFIYIMGLRDDYIDGPYDWRSTQNDNLWQGVSGINNPCLSGWRLPTSDEWDIERLSWSSNNAEGAFASPLKLTEAGYRYHSYTTTTKNDSMAPDGRYWSSTVDDTGSLIFILYFFGHGHGSANIQNSYRAMGYSVRCIKD